MNLFSGTIARLERGLAYSSVKQKVIANNIANVDTAGYKSKDVSFNKMLQTEMQLSSSGGESRHPKHFNLTSGETNPKVYNRMYSVRENGNGVDMDREMANLATNQIYYDAMIERVSGKFGSLTTVIRGGR
ncbi:flagellar basal body rod protein FlgB [Jeotgalibacillus soli]|uniref:Flagellar basal body rod protein FlgB n=1 Tax=Jeotgalibacillus soli TaxID=889306 RepID=A0A0C2R3P2_9BACL|nr:flagellar basal body rod protein FlgB [Jeotgalibacillus soli]KIL44880.1 flagellar basal body rod protein FlgB [Jeotgalibacillus soli]